jgi:hypothetical protein
MERPAWSRSTRMDHRPAAGRMLVRVISMVFDRYLRADRSVRATPR